MRYFATPILFVLLLSSQIVSAKFQYLSPLPGSKMINIEHNVIVRDGNLLQKGSLHPDIFSITGARSGVHKFNLVLSTDDKTIILNPLTPFAYDEEVTVTIGDGLQRI